MNKNILPIIILMMGLFFLFQNNEYEKEEVKSYITVDIKGAVKSAGTYKMEEGDKIYELIEEAGGLRFDASTRYINLAKTLEDEMVVVIYTIDEVDNGNVNLDISYCNCPEVKNDGCLVNEENNKEKININTADLDLLMTLPGIGKSKAQAIIDYRTTNGSFTKIEDVMNVKGIGNGMFEKIKSYIIV